ncbi:hypothetical protein HQQ94_13395 [Shewanella sp. VB17]|nr:hypothetical protein [Shewanella sp. VB17]NRD74212.1 hypothetical protein [Shewanella sp. VB17]
MNKIDLTAPIPFHLAHTKGVDFVYKDELAALNCMFEVVNPKTRSIKVK